MKPFIIAGGVIASLTMIGLGIGVLIGTLIPIQQEKQGKLLESETLYRYNKEAGYLEVFDNGEWKESEHVKFDSPFLGEKQLEVHKGGKWKADTDEGEFDN